MPCYTTGIRCFLQGVEYGFYEVRPNLNSDASNLNLVARNFHEMPSVKNKGAERRKTSACRLKTLPRIGNAGLWRRRGVGRG